MDFEFYFQLIKLGFGVTALVFFAGIVGFLGLTFYLEVWARCAVRRKIPE